ncbi:phage tail sheath subtilisin-like domain-containing protein [Nostoc sp. GT001]|uniref:phage tail sheath subtilisin-like domain-containing protein n=1 Tax=Nostoc sp. GT001 TaxID=3056647 RepID=UPI0025AA4C49|nr:phage tail sheath subtilisin-like domain-containing protein [Nostoc sp. GT001]MDM9583104.1 phage tail sheath subtilisin-like domain-containing protein [Nostoc sp. GT001]
MPQTLNINQLTAPGVYVYEDTAGVIPADIASFNRAYLIGTGTTGAYNTPTQVTSADDFVTKFGTSPSLNSVKLFFNNISNGILFFVRAASKQIATVTAGTPTEGNYSLTVSGTAITYAADSTPTAQEIVDGLIGATNSNGTVAALVTASDDGTGNSTFIITSDTVGTSFTVTSPTAPVGSTLSVTVNTYPGLADDYVYAIQNSFDPDLHEQGILICPEAFSGLTNQSDRTSVATAMENLCATEGFDWITFVDSGPSGTINTPALAQTESANYTTARGHLAYFFPYVVDLFDNTIPPSAGVAAIALRRYRAEGFQQAAAGTKYPMRGVKDVAVIVKKAEQAVVNPNGVNCIRNLPGQGVVVYGSRTRSASPYYKFVNTRIILSVFNRTLFTAFETGGVIFSAVDGQGVLFTRIRETAEAICYRFWSGGAFFGAQPKDAFLVRCDRSNNPAIDLEAGIVRVDIYVVPVPTLERLLIGSYRVAIDQIQQAAGAA